MAVDKYILTGRDEVEVSKAAKGDEHTYVQKIGNIKSIEDFKTIFQVFSNDWIFRGQNDASLALNPSIQRCRGYTDWDSYEEPLVEILVSSKSALKNWPQLQKLSYLEKLAYIQHYGGKTRFLDFSYDWRVACFFALNLDRKCSLCNILRGIGSKKPKFCVVWAFNLKAIKSKALQLMRDGGLVVPASEEEILNTIIKTDKMISFVYPFDLGSNKSLRMHRQQSLLLVQCDPCISFGNNLFNVSENQVPDRVDYKQFELIGKKIYVPFALKKDIEQYLNQSGFSKERLLPDGNVFSDMEKLICKVESKAKGRLKLIKKKQNGRRFI